MSEWIEWDYTKDKPFPETVETLVAIKTGYDGYQEGLVKEWEWETLGCKTDITHYKVVD